MDKKKVNMKIPQLGDTVYYVCDNQLTIRSYDIESMNGQLNHYTDKKYKELYSKGFKFKSINLNFNSWGKTATLYATFETGDYRFTGSGWGSQLFFTMDEATNRLRELKDVTIQRLQKEIDKLK